MYLDNQFNSHLFTASIYVYIYVVDRLKPLKPASGAIVLAWNARADGGSGCNEDEEREFHGGW